VEPSDGGRDNLVNKHRKYERGYRRGGERRLAPSLKRKAASSSETEKVGADEETCAVGRGTAARG